MEDYLKGFNDGYKKALEQIGNPKLKLTIDSKEIAEIIYKDVTELQERENKVKRSFE